MNKTAKKELEEKILNDNIDEDYELPDNCFICPADLDDCEKCKNYLKTKKNKNNAD